MPSKRLKPNTIVSIKNNDTQQEPPTKLDAPDKDKDTLAPLSSGTKSVQDYVSEITSTWNKTVDGIFETGIKLIEAKDALGHGQFEQMVRDELPFRERTAERLMAIASNTRLSKDDYRALLPPSWGTLYELTTLDDKAFEAGVNDGIINPEMTRRSITTLKRLGSRNDIKEKGDITRQKRRDSRQILNTLRWLNDKLATICDEAETSPDLRAREYWIEMLNDIEVVEMLGKLELSLKSGLEMLKKYPETVDVIDDMFISSEGTEHEENSMYNPSSIPSPT
jgi:Protein of unknown function (DUF3102)